MAFKEYFLGNSSVTPDYIYAMKAGTEDESLRPLLTI